MLLYINAYYYILSHINVYYYILLHITVIYAVSYAIGYRILSHAIINIMLKDYVKDVQRISKKLTKVSNSL